MHPDAREHAENDLQKSSKRAIVQVEAESGRDSHSCGRKVPRLQQELPALALAVSIARRSTQSTPISSFTNQCHLPTGRPSIRFSSSICQQLQQLRIANILGNRQAPSACCVC